MKRSKYILACLDCGDEYKAKNEFIRCPSCDGAGELSVSNYENPKHYDNEYNDYDDFQDYNDISIDNLVYNPDIYD